MITSENCICYTERNNVGQCRGTTRKTCAGCPFYKDKKEYIKECKKLYGDEWEIRSAIAGWTNETNVIV